MSIRVAKRVKYLFLEKKTSFFDELIVIGNKECSELIPYKNRYLTSQVIFSHYTERVKHVFREKMSFYV